MTGGLGAGICLALIGSVFALAAVATSIQNKLAENQHHQLFDTMQELVDLLLVREGHKDSKKVDATATAAADVDNTNDADVPDVDDADDVVDETATLLNN